MSSHEQSASVASGRERQRRFPSSIFVLMPGTQRCRRRIVPYTILFLLLVSRLVAQGTRDDYERAQQFLQDNLQHVLYIADVNPHWIEKTSHFVYRRSAPGGSEFILVDAERNTSGPPFDHARLAAALAQADKREYSASDLPFREFEFVDGNKSIQFTVDKADWTCSLSKYECQKNSVSNKNENEEMSPNKRWAAFVRDHNLFLRDVSTALRLMTDQGTEDVKQRYPYMDIERVGIFGTSAGGYGAAHAMLAFPDFYKVGVSTSGDHDARLDKAWWNELYQGYPVQDDYVSQSNVTMAGQLKGHLLLEHGDIDDNVHPVETMRLVDALMKANKNFDMLLVPNMYHGESGDHRLYLVRRRWDYFVQYLLGVTPPSNFEIKEERDSGNGRRRRR